MTADWQGLTLRHGRRKARVQHSHGCWLAIAYDRRGNVSSGEYFPYGPGAIQRAKEWCEARLGLRKQRR